MSNLSKKNHFWRINTLTNRVTLSKQCGYGDFLMYFNMLNRDLLSRSVSVNMVQSICRICSLDAVAYDLRKLGISFNVPYGFCGSIWFARQSKTGKLVKILNRMKWSYLHTPNLVLELVERFVYVVSFGKRVLRIASFCRHGSHNKFHTRVTTLSD